VKRNLYNTNMIGWNNACFAINAAEKLQAHHYDLSNPVLRRFLELTEAYYGQESDYIPSLIVRSVHLWVSEGEGKLTDFKVVKTIRKAKKIGSQYAREHCLTQGDNPHEDPNHLDHYWPLIQGMMIATREGLNE